MGLGIRAEGHYCRRNRQQSGHISQWTLGFEHQFSADSGGRLDFNYSLSNESTLNLGFSLPEGDEPDANGIESEFGIYPRSITVELRVYY